MTLVDYLAQQRESNYSFKPHPLFTDLTDFSKVKGPMASLFEDQACLGCDEFHQEVLRYKDVIHELILESGVDIDFVK